VGGVLPLLVGMAGLSGLSQFEKGEDDASFVPVQSTTATGEDDGSLPVESESSERSDEGGQDAVGMEQGAVMAATTHRPLPTAP